MIIIRTIFWVSLVVLLLPVGSNGQSNVMGAAKHALNDMDNFCTRNIDVCNIGTETWKSLKYKAAYSFDVVANIAKEVRENGNQSYSPVYKSVPNQWGTGSLKKPASLNDTPLDHSRGTLTDTDLQPKWNLKQSQKADI